MCYTLHVTYMSTDRDWEQFEDWKLEVLALLGDSANPLNFPLGSLSFLLFPPSSSHTFLY